MDYIHSKDFQSNKIKERANNINEIVYYIPTDYNISNIHEKIKIILDSNKNTIIDILGKFNFAELLEVETLLNLHLLSENIEVYKKYLANNGGINLNIDYGNQCSFACSHCSIEGNKNGKKLKTDDIKEYFGNFSTFKDVINEIVFYNGGEIFERDNFDEIFNFFLERGINSFSMISRGLNEKNKKDYDKKKNIIQNKFKKLKKKFPEFQLKIGVSIDNFSKLTLGQKIYNILFLFDLNSIFDNKQIYYSCTSDDFNRKDTDELIGISIYYLEKYIQLGKSYFLFNIINDEILYKINKIINLGEFQYLYNDGERNTYYKHNKTKHILQFDYTSINTDGRGKKQLEKNLSPNETIDDILNEVTPIYGDFQCLSLTEPKNISIQTGGKIKTCTASHLKYQKDFNYNNIKNMTETQFIENIAKNQTGLYKKIGIHEIIKLIKRKRKGDFICMNNMLSSNDS